MRYEFKIWSGNYIIKITPKKEKIEGSFRDGELRWADFEERHLCLILSMIYWPLKVLVLY